MEALEEQLVGIVERVTFHSPETGWSVLKVSPFHSPQSRVTVRVHQAQVFAGATMEFRGQWRVHSKYGEQFEAKHALERKPASSAALERYLGSGMIHGVGPKTARKIVNHFGAATLDVFEEHIERLTEVRGIAELKLVKIREAWETHRAIRDVMLFLQEYGVSTLFAVKIFKEYGQKSIATVRDNPYQLARDIYGIGFFSADRIALALGFAEDSPERIEACVKHVLDASREQGHCYLTRAQVHAGVCALLASPQKEPVKPEVWAGRIDIAMQALGQQRVIRTRELPAEALPAPLRAEGATRCYYATSLYRAEERVAAWVQSRVRRTWPVDAARVEQWLGRFCSQSSLQLSPQQRDAVHLMARQGLCVLTGGPGCGKTTTTRALVRLLVAMGKNVLLAAPTGRAAQRMMEVIGQPARTIHRLLEWNVRSNAFTRNQEQPLVADYVIVDETSMLDITLAADLFAAIAPNAQTLLIGDPEQLPAVGAGNVLADLLAYPTMPRASLTQVFRQAQASHIVQHAHRINHGETPNIPSPLAEPTIWKKPVDCLFVDAEEATQEQLRFLRRAKAAIASTQATGESQHLLTQEGKHRGTLVRVDGKVAVAKASPVAKPQVATAPEPPEPQTPTFVVPRKFLHVQWDALALTQDVLDELRVVLRRIHPHSALNYGMSALDVIVRLYAKTLPEKLGAGTEIQVLTPMQRGSLGAHAMNVLLQKAVNPPAFDKPELLVGERILRVGDRVMQRRNNYDHNVFNGDIGQVIGANPSTGSCQVRFGRGDTVHEVTYPKEDLAELMLAYATTVHKSQGSEFQAVIIPVTTQHYTMLFRNLIYTALTRAKTMAVFVGTRGALQMAVANVDTRARQTALTHLLLRGAAEPHRAC
jgi:exodeoxyribonuclease V alpha subunit